MSRTFVRSFEQPTVITLGPMYLSEEGLSEDWEVSSDVLKVMKRGWRAAVATLFGCPSLTVIRRTALGRPRFQSAPSNLPRSWQPWERAAEVLG